MIEAQDILIYLGIFAIAWVIFCFGLIAFMVFRVAKSISSTLNVVETAVKEGRHVLEGKAEEFMGKMRNFQTVGGIISHFMKKK